MQLFRHLDRSRFEPRLYCLNGAGELIDQVRALGIEVFNGHIHGSLISPAVAAGIVRFARAFRRDRIDVVHTFLPRGELVGAVAGWLARVPVVVCSKRGCHYRHGTEAIGVRIANRLADRVLANARAVQDFVAADEGCRQEKMVVIENGIETRRFVPVTDPRPYRTRLGLNPDTPVVGTITRARVRKGYEEFLRATAEVRRTRPDTQVVVVGEKTREEAPHQLIAELGLTDHLHLLGLRTDIPDVLAAFDIFVLSSHDEGMSNAIMEAMAVGKPVVATDVGGTAEMVEAGASGLLVPPREVAPLADAIGALLDNPVRAARMGSRGRQIIEERFSLEVMVSRVQSLYETLWATKRGALQAMPSAGLGESIKRETLG